MDYQKYKSFYELVLKTSQDKEKLNLMLQDGWQIFDRGIYMDADGKEPDRAFFFLGNEKPNAKIPKI